MIRVDSLDLSKYKSFGFTPLCDIMNPIDNINRELIIRGEYVASDKYYVWIKSSTNPDISSASLEGEYIKYEEAVLIDITNP